MINFLYQEADQPVKSTHKDHTGLLESPENLFLRRTNTLQCPKHGEASSANIVLQFVSRSSIRQIEWYFANPCCSTYTEAIDAELPEYLKAARNNS